MHKIDNHPSSIIDEFTNQSQIKQKRILVNRQRDCIPLTNQLMPNSAPTHFFRKNQKHEPPESNLKFTVRLLYSKKLKQLQLTPNQMSKLSLSTSWRNHRAIKVQEFIELVLGRLRLESPRNSNQNPEFGVFKFLNIEKETNNHFNFKKEKNQRKSSQLTRLGQEYNFNHKEPSKRCFSSQRKKFVLNRNKVMLASLKSSNIQYENIEWIKNIEFFLSFSGIKIQDSKSLEILEINFVENGFFEIVKMIETTSKKSIVAKEELIEGSGKNLKNRNTKSQNSKISSAESKSSQKKDHKPKSDSLPIKSAKSNIFTNLDEDSPSLESKKDSKDFESEKVGLASQPEEKHKLNMEDNRKKSKILNKEEFQLTTENEIEVTKRQDQKFSNKFHNSMKLTDDTENSNSCNHSISKKTGTNKKKITVKEKWKKFLKEFESFIEEESNFDKNSKNLKYDTIQKNLPKEELRLLTEKFILKWAERNGTRNMNLNCPNIDSSFFKMIIKRTESFLEFLVSNKQMFGALSSAFSHPREGQDFFYKFFAKNQDLVLRDLQAQKHLRTFLTNFKENQKVKTLLKNYILKNHQSLNTEIHFEKFCCFFFKRCSKLELKAFNSLIEFYTDRAHELLNYKKKAGKKIYLTLIELCASKAQIKTLYSKLKQKVRVLLFSRESNFLVRFIYLQGDQQIRKTIEKNIVKDPLKILTFKYSKFYMLTIIKEKKSDSPFLKELVHKIISIDE